MQTTDGESERRKPLVIAGMPMYNEEETIGTVVTMVSRHVDLVICVDDGSSDASARIAEANGAMVLRHRVNRGYGGALKTLFHKAKELDADALVILDSDGQHEANDIPSLLEPIMSGEADFAIGSRFIDGGMGTDMPAYRRLGIKVITATNNLSSNSKIKDTQSGFRAFSKLALERLRFDSEGMELSLEMIDDAVEKDLKVKEIPTIIRYDVPKGSNYTAVSHGFTVLSWARIVSIPKETSLSSWITWSRIASHRSCYGSQYCTKCNNNPRLFSWSGFNCDLGRLAWINTYHNRTGSPKCKKPAKIVDCERVRS